MRNYDIITIGGGIGGSVFARAMAERGFRVLLVERETAFRDRVRGEFIFPWGVAEAKELGVYDLLLAAGAHQPAWWVDYAGPSPLPPRNLAADTAQKLPGLSIYHPHMQEALLNGAASAGVEVRRGVRAGDVMPGELPAVLIESGSGVAVVTGRIVVAADGRASRMRDWCGFETRTDPPGNIIAGVLLDNVPAAADSCLCMTNPYASRMALYFPQSEAGGRAYLVSRAESGARLRGAADFDRFLEECVSSGLAPGLFDGARQAGPLASFDGNNRWVEHPYGSGCALIGDAAATTDPSWGQGLSLALRDARVLRDTLLASDDWHAAGHAYAAEHDRCFELVRTVESWYTQIFLEPGPRADEIRARVFPQLETDPTVLPDTIFSGPDATPPTDAHRVRIFGQPVAPLL